MSRTRVCYAAACALLVAAPAGAQPYYARGDYYAGTGAVWSYDAGNQLYDDGQHGDGLAGDGIYAATVVSDQAPGYHQFKIGNADWSELWPHNPEYSLANAQLSISTTGEAVFFRLDTNPRPGWEPETGAVVCDHGLPAGVSLEIMGDAPELGSWNTPVPATLQDGVWSATVVFVNPGPIEYKFRSAGSWDWPFGVHYNMLRGDNFQFAVPQGGAAYRIEFDTRDGRSTVEYVTPAVRTTWGALKRGLD